MPANLPPQYHEAEKRFRQARSTSERIDALEEMMAIMPKHKGTDKLRADLRARMAKLSQEAEQRGGPGGRADPFLVRREGAGQVVLAGRPNSGKSQLLSALTSASPRVADYPFTTQEPLPGMMEFENISIQLVDAPAVTYKDAHAGLSLLLRRADLVLIVLDLSQDPAAQMAQVLDDLADRRLDPSRENTLIAATKADFPGAAESFKHLEAKYGGRFHMIAVSTDTGSGLEELRRRLFQALDIVRVYTKAPGQPPDMTQPVILRRGDTVEEVAASIHKDFLRRLKYVQVWGSGKFSGQRVPRG
ncbi:MAG: GTPase [Dehalococcoidia bacterium]